MIEPGIQATMLASTHQTPKLLPTKTGARSTSTWAEVSKTIYLHSLRVVRPGLGFVNVLTSLAAVKLG